MGSTTDIVMLQTADSQRYLPMLQATSAVNQTYCALQNLGYSQFVGIKRGYHPWHACFNRIILMKEMIDAGFGGWVFYLDADAFVVDLSYDVRGLISQIEKPIIMAPGGASGKHWDVNDGVFLIDLSNDDAQDVVLAWYADFMSTSDDALRAAVEWEAVPSDQPRLHKIFQRNHRSQSFLGAVDRNLLNYKAGAFVKQILRVATATWEERLAMVQKEAAAVLLSRKAAYSGAAIATV